VTWASSPTLNGNVTSRYAAAATLGAVTPTPAPAELLAVALDEARAGYAEGGVPVGAALFTADGTLLGRGRNRRVQDGDPATHGETAAFRAAGRRPNYLDTVMVTTLSPCWFCTGLIRQFRIPRLVVGEARTFGGGHEWLAGHGVDVVVLDDPECAELMGRFAREQPATWAEDIGEGT
jgi:creatinine deaminase